jgi:hypothetical protein
MEGLRLSFIYGLREISCQLLPAGGSMDPRNVLQLLFSEKSQLPETQQPLKLEKI